MPVARWRGAYKLIPWPIRVLLYADEELDLVDRRTGHADYAKIVGFLTFLIFCGLTLIDKLPPLGHTIALLFVAYGWAGLRLYSKMRGVPPDEVDQADVAEGFLEHPSGAHITTGP